MAMNFNLINTIAGNNQVLSGGLPNSVDNVPVLNFGEQLSADWAKMGVDDKIRQGATNSHNCNGATS